MVRAFVEADAPRVNCRVHGPTVIAVPWARHAAGHTRAFDDLVAWLAVHTSKSAVVELLRIAWVTVGAIVTRVNADIDAAVDRFAGLRRIGIDEISYKKGHKYLIVVVDHDTDVSCGQRRGVTRRTLHRFFDRLGVQRCAADHPRQRRCRRLDRCGRRPATAPTRCRRWTRSTSSPGRPKPSTRSAAKLERSPRRPPPAPGRDPPQGTWPARARQLQRVRWALWKNPDNLTDRQRHQLDWIAGNHPDLWRAYRLKEGLRYVFAVKGDEGKEALDRWLMLGQHDRSSRRSSNSPAASAVTELRSTSPSTTGLSNARTESTNTKIRLLTRIAFGFKNTNALIALTMLALGGHPPTLPGRTRTHGWGLSDSLCNWA